MRSPFQQKESKLEVDIRLSSQGELEVKLNHFDEQDLELIRSLPNRRWDTKGGVWRAPCTEQVLESLMLS